MANTNQENLEKAGIQVLQSHNVVHTFTVEHNGKSYTFHCRPQGINSTFQICGRANQILKSFGLSPDDDPLARDLAFEIATLEAYLVNRPPEFADFLNLPPEVDDWDFIHKIYQEVANFLVSFRKGTSTTQ